ncbi:MFS transporter [Streptomyces kurssanovii]|uniref:MFS transporter n=1 Tax=Streptomyces kurssanovii TaxID=67312 RepID=A0ABV3I1K8_9ACTN
MPSPSGSREEALPEAVAAVSLKGHRSFNAYLTGEAASLLGTSVHAVALPALAVLELGAGPDQVALLALLGHLPSFVLALPAGVVVDRHGKKRLLVVTDLVAAAAVAAIPVSAAAGVLSIAVLYAVALTVGAATVLHNAAAISVVPQLVPAGLLHAANSRVGVAFSSADIAGTYAGTAVVAVVGASRAFALDTVSYLLSAWCASRIRLERPAAVPVRRRMMRQIVEGMGYVARDPLARPLVASLAVTGLGTGMVNTYWGFHLLTALQAGPVGLGVVMGVCGAGGLVGAFLAPRLVRRFGPGRVLVTSFTLCAAMGVPLLLARPGAALAGGPRSGRDGADGRGGVRRYDAAVRAAADLPAGAAGPGPADIDVACDREPVPRHRGRRCPRRDDVRADRAGGRHGAAVRAGRPAVPVSRARPGPDAGRAGRCIPSVSSSPWSVSSCVEL